MQGTEVTIKDDQTETGIAPMWKYLEADGPRDILCSIAMEGVHRLVVRPTDDYRRKLIEAVRQTGGFALSNAVESYVNTLLLEVSDVPARLGLCAGPLHP